MILISVFLFAKKALESEFYILKRSWYFLPNPSLPESHLLFEWHVRLFFYFVSLFVHLANFSFQVLVAHLTLIRVWLYLLCISFIVFPTLGSSQMEQYKLIFNIYFVCIFLYNGHSTFKKEELKWSECI